MEPCEGIFADVRKLPPENITVENREFFVEKYKYYKRFFEEFDGMIFVCLKINALYAICYFKVYQLGPI